MLTTAISGWKVGSGFDVVGFCKLDGIQVELRLSPWDAIVHFQEQPKSFISVQRCKGQMSGQKRPDHTSDEPNMPGPNEIHEARPLERSFDFQRLF